MKSFRVTMASTFIPCLALLVCLLSTVHCVCPNGWTQYDSSCFAVFESPSSWTDASVLCREFGGHLATLNTTTKINQAREFIIYINHQQSVWIGGSDIGVDGMWVWDVTQTPIGSLNDWAKGEPNGGTNQNCISVYASKQYHWVDSSCTREFDFLCERAAT